MRASSPLRRRAPITRPTPSSTERRDSRLFWYSIRIRRKSAGPRGSASSRMKLGLSEMSASLNPGGRGSGVSIAVSQWRRAGSGPIGGLESPWGAL